jgi:hypothetical protein
MNDEPKYHTTMTLIETIEKEIEMKERWCCYIDQASGAPCIQDAQWQICYGRTTDDFTEACEEHVGELLEEGVVNHVYPIDVTPQSKKESEDEAECT